MTEGITVRGSIYQLTLSLTWRNMNMGQKTHGPCPNRVSDVAVSGVDTLGLFFLFFCSGEGNGEVLRRYSHIAMGTNT